ncbi:MAG: D-alanine--D-alanine ligase family protein [Candidatus Saccharimonadales bacterium]
MQTIAVIFGGRSAEHDISIVTAISSIIKPLQVIGQYNIEAVYIAKNGAWFWGDKFKDISLFAGGDIENFIDKSQPCSVQFDGGLRLTKPGAGITGRKVSRKIDIVFPAMHGTYGEDGSLAGLLEMAGVPYVGCGLDASVLAMDKVLAKQVAASNGIPIAKYQQVNRDTFTKNPDHVIGDLEESLIYPMFVKPTHLGSSIGITRAANREELQNGLEVAVHYDDKVVVEEEVANLIEVTLPIMGNHELTPALLERPLSSADDFFNFETKYMQGGKKGGAKKGGSKGSQGYSEIPAKLPKSLYEKAEQTAIETYRALGCSGTARVDLLIDSNTEEVYFNEVNPLPGSLYAHNWRASGVSSVELVQSLVRLAIERHEEKKAINTAFATNFLKQF